MKQINHYEQRLTHTLVALSQAADKVMMTPVQIRKVADIRYAGESLLHGLIWAKSETTISEDTWSYYSQMVDEYISSCSELIG